MNRIIAETVGQSENWPDFYPLGLGIPAIKPLKAVSFTFYAYHAVKFHRNVVFTVFGDNVSPNVDFSGNCRIFGGALRAAKRHFM